MSLTTYFNHLILAVLLCTSIFVVCNADESDISCLRSIKDSMEDSHGYFKISWNFDNQTEGFICDFTGVVCWNALESRVFGIILPDMGLKGQFPRGLENCTSLASLDLSSNQLYGPLPSNMKSIIPYVTHLNLSSNNFSGEIPSDIANCSFLNMLSLDHNKFVGVIPPQIALLNRLKEFSFANNMLVGGIPSFLNLTVTRDNFTNNMDLCGYPMKPCKQGFDYSFKGGFVIGYIVFFLSVTVVSISYCTPWVRVRSGKEMITVATMVMLTLRRRWRMRRKWNNKQKMEVESHVANSADSGICQEESKEISRLEKLVTRLSYQDINEATDSFSKNNVIGCGDRGTMYKATLPNGCSVAVKRLNHSHFLVEQITPELNSLGILRHPNLLPLLGFCITSDEKLVVYKFLPNGSLYDWLHLHPFQESRAKVLEWPVRVKIAVGLARGLAWLHEKTDFRIIHLNVCSKSILLDQDFEPRLSNFSEAMIMRRKNNHFSTNSDNVDSGFWEMAFIKEDVYSFGIVLLEMITGEEPCKVTGSEIENGIDGGHPNEWVSNLLSNVSSNRYELIDPFLIRKGFDDEIFQFLLVASDCVQPDPDQRPTMLQVYEHLKSYACEVVHPY